MGRCFAQIVIGKRPVLFLDSEPEVGEVITNVRHDVRLIWRILAACSRDVLRVVSSAWFHWDFLLRMGFGDQRPEQDGGCSADKHPDSETDRKQHAGWE